MTRRRRFIVVLAVMALVTALPVGALADESEEVEEGEEIEAGDPTGHLDIITALEAEFVDSGLDPAEVRVLFDAGLGLGEIFRLHQIAVIGQSTIADLLAQMTGEDGELALAFGEWRHSLSPEQLALLEGLPRNLGDLVSSLHRPEHAGRGQSHGNAYGHSRHGGGD